MGAGTPRRGWRWSTSGALRGLWGLEAVEDLAERAGVALARLAPLAAFVGHRPARVLDQVCQRLAGFVEPLPRFFQQRRQAQQHEQLRGELAHAGAPPELSR